MPDQILLAVTTYNQLPFTKLCVESIKKITDVNYDLMIFDDVSKDGTQQWCYKNTVTIKEKDTGRGLTDSWNNAYKHFKDNANYKYIVLTNNDILVPNGALSEMVDVFNKWPFSLVVPLSTRYGAGHNGQFQGIENHYQLDANFVTLDVNYQIVQDQILSIKTKLTKENNLYFLDPLRMKMFNGFFFMMSRNIIKYERDDGFLFDSKFLMDKAEDQFNWSTLIPNNDFSAVCKTAFIYHYKGMSVSKVKDYKHIANDPNKLFENR